MVNICGLTAPPMSPHQDPCWVSPYFQTPLQGGVGFTFLSLALEICLYSSIYLPYAIWDSFGNSSNNEQNFLKFSDNHILTLILPFISLATQCWAQCKWKLTGLGQVQYPCPLYFPLGSVCAMQIVTRRLMVAWTYLWSRLLIGMRNEPQTAIYLWFFSSKM